MGTRHDQAATTAGIVLTNAQRGLPYRQANCMFRTLAVVLRRVSRKTPAEPTHAVQPMPHQVEKEFECDTFLPPLDPEKWGVWSASEPLVENGVR